MHEQNDENTWPFQQHQLHEAAPGCIERFSQHRPYEAKQPGPPLGARFSSRVWGVSVGYRRTERKASIWPNIDISIWYRRFEHRPQGLLGAAGFRPVSQLVLDIVPKIAMYRKSRCIEPSDFRYIGHTEQPGLRGVGLRPASQLLIVMDIVSKTAMYRYINISIFDKSATRSSPGCCGLSTVQCFDYSSVGHRT